MDQRFSVLGLFFTILVSAENPFTVPNNALNKPVIMVGDYPSIKTRTIFSNKKLSDFDSNIHNLHRTKNLNSLNASRMNSTVPIPRPSKSTKLKHFSQKTRFPRQAENISNKNNKGDSAERHIQILLDLQPENEENKYDYYDNQKHNDDIQGKHISAGFKDDMNLNKEIENNSKLVSRNLSESQERKRCTKTNYENLNSRRLQQSGILTLENNEEGKIPTFELLKSNMDSAEPSHHYGSSSVLKKRNDDYFINILNQLIDKLNKSKNYANDKELLARQSIEPMSLENKSAEGNNTNSSPEEELILKLEKIKGNRIRDKLNSSPENTFVNGKWVKNNLRENKINDKPVEIDQRSEFNYTYEPISSNDLKLFNSTDPENQVIDNNEDIVNNFDNLQTIDVQENKDTSTSPLPEDSGNFVASSATVIPIYYLTSTQKDKLDSPMIDENHTLKFTTNDYIYQFNNEDNNTDQGKSNEPTLNNIHTTANYESNNDDLSFDLNNTSKTKNLEEISGSNVGENNTPKTNYSEDVTTAGDSIVGERENDSFEDDGKCRCNKKVIKNILSSTMVQNITEIKTGSYISPSSSKIKSHKRSDKLQNTDGIPSEGVLKKIKNDLNSNLLRNKQITNEKPMKQKLGEPDVNMVQKSTSVPDDIQPQDTNYDKTNTKTGKNKSSQKYVTPEIKNEQLQINDQKKRNYEEKNNDVVGVQKHRISLIPKNLQEKNPRQYIPKKIHYAESNKDVNNNPANKRISNISKSSNKIPNKIVSQIPARSLIEKSKENTRHGSSSIKSPEKVIPKLKHGGLSDTNVQNTPRYNGGSYNTDDVPTTKRASYVPKSLIKTPTKIDGGSSATLMSKHLETIQDSDVNGTKNKPRKLNSEPHKYARFDQNPRVGITQRENIDGDFQKNGKTINGLDLAELRKPSDLADDYDRAKTNRSPKYYKYENVVKARPTEREPTDGENSADAKRNGINDRVAKMLSPSDARLQVKNTTTTTLRLKQLLNDARAKYNSLYPVANPQRKTDDDKAFLKKQNTATERPFAVHKTDPTENAAAAAFPRDSTHVTPRRSKISRVDVAQDREHGPYKSEDLEPIVFDRSTGKNSESAVGRNPSPPSSSPRPVSIDDHHDSGADARRNDDPDGGGPRDPQERNRAPRTDGEERPAGRGGYRVMLPRVTLDDGSAYVSDVYVQPIGGGRPLTGDDVRFEPWRADEPPPPPPPPTTGSDAEPCGDRSAGPDVVGPWDPTVLTRGLGRAGGDEKPIHLIQIINNGHCAQCAGDGTRNAVGRARDDPKEDGPRPFRNGGQPPRRVQQQSSSAARSRDPAPADNNNRQKLESAYKHFDSEILDRFLQVYALPRP